MSHPCSRRISVCPRLLLLMQRIFVALDETADELRRTLPRRRRKHCQGSRTDGRTDRWISVTRMDTSTMSDPSATDATCSVEGDGRSRRILRRQDTLFGVRSFDHSLLAAARILQSVNADHSDPWSTMTRAGCCIYFTFVSE